MDDNASIFQKFCKSRECADLSVLADAKLHTEDGWTFDVHRAILANNNLFFRHLFCDFPSDRSVVIIPKFKGTILDEVLHFIYAGSTLFNRENFIELMLASDYLQVDELSSQIKKFSESILSIDNCLKIYMTSVKINDLRLRELSYRVIQTNFQNLVNRYEEDFVDLPVESITEILSDNNLRVHKENAIWEFILKWINRDPINRLKEVYSCLKCLKIGDVEESLANEIIRSDVISMNPYCENLKNVTFQNFHSSSDALKYIIDSGSESPSIPPSDVSSHRLPSFLHLIICETLPDSDLQISDSIDMYVTYDEKIDIWQKLCEFESIGNFINVVGSDVYVFGTGVNTQIFNLCEKEWHLLENSFHNLSLCKWSGTIRNNIYFIFNICHSLKVEFYNTENGQWYDAPLMYPVHNFEIVSVLNKIFVVGQVPDESNLRMLAQVYEEESNSWSIISPPSIYRYHFRLTAYHGKLYIIDGMDEFSEVTSIVEVFDIEKNKWARIGDLPFTNENLRIGLKMAVLVLNDQLFVLDSWMGDEQYILNESNKAWEIPEKPLFLENFIIQIHRLCDKQIIKTLVKESRHPATSLMKSSFQ